LNRADLVLLHARQLVTCAGPAPKTGAAQSDIRAIEDGAIASCEGQIVYAGSTAALAASIEIDSAARVVDLGNKHTVVPGFVDAHTHAAFAGDRDGELRRRLAGESYEQITASGGGIASTVAATRAASEAELIAATRSRLDEMLACGTTTCEIKSGYGLTLESELKLLRTIKALAVTHPMTITATFLGAHDIPLEHRSNRTKYVDLVVDEMIPAVAREGLAEWCDVFCEDGVFTPSESQRILNVGRQSGLEARIHADELGRNGGSRVAAMVAARSADHLIFVAPDDIRLLAAAEVTATLLPVAAFYLKLGRFAPARTLIAAGVPVAIATDVNPGGGLSPSMPFAMALACFGMVMTFEEALVAATLNGAWSLDRADIVGSLEPGKLTDAVIVSGDATNLLRVGADSIRAVLKRGNVVHGTLPWGRTPV
jgi:imidazolonepropionase